MIVIPGVTRCEIMIPTTIDDPHQVCTSTHMYVNRASHSCSMPYPFLSESRSSPFEQLFLWIAVRVANTARLVYPWSIGKQKSRWRNGSLFVLGALVLEPSICYGQTPGIQKQMYLSIKQILNDHEWYAVPCDSIRFFVPFVWSPAHSLHKIVHLDC